MCEAFRAKGHNGCHLVSNTSERQGDRDRDRKRTHRCSKMSTSGESRGKKHQFIVLFLQLFSSLNSFQLKRLKKIKLFFHISLLLCNQEGENHIRGIGEQEAEQSWFFYDLACSLSSCVSSGLANKYSSHYRRKVSP